MLQDKYKCTPAEISKLRIQYKAQFNNLRKTYHEIVLQRSPYQKKHFNERFTMTTLLPENQRSLKKQHSQRRHYSPICITQGFQKSISPGKKQFHNKSIDNLTNVLRQKYQVKKKPLEIKLKLKKSIKNLAASQFEVQSIAKRMMNKNHPIKIPKSSIKIIPKYHKYDENFFG